MGTEQFDYEVNTPAECYGNRDFTTNPARNSMVFLAPNSPGRFFEHPVSKLDTLAGVAIRYGVEVADIKKMNGLITDRQMFGLKTLRIPQPGRHPPSPSLSNGCITAGNNISAKTPPRSMLPDILDSFESLNTNQEQKLSPAMSSLQGYTKETAIPVENGSLIQPSSNMKPLLNLLGKSRSLANVFHFDEDETGNSEADFTSRIPEKILKESGITGWFSAITEKGLALRTKASNRSNSDSEATNTNASSLLASIIADGLLGVRKSSSTPVLQDEDNNSSSISIWSGSWNLKSDLQPILDGWANPITGRKTKTALD